MSAHFDEAAAQWDEDPQARERAVAVAAGVAPLLAGRAGLHALEFGSGTGLLGFALLDAADGVAAITFADPSAGMLEQVRRKIAARGVAKADTLLLEGSPPRLPDAYDVIVSLMTMHHVEDYAATIAALVDRLRPDGRLAVCDFEPDGDGSFHGDTETVHDGIDPEAMVRIFGDRGLVDVARTTPYVMHRERGGRRRAYPLFLVTGRKG